MKGLHKYRAQHIKNANALSASPNIRQVFASQSNAESPAALLAREFRPVTAAQNADGEWLFVLGYSRTGDGDVLG